MIYAFGDCELDTERYELRRGDAREHVEPQVFDVLAYLLGHRDRVVTREELLAQVWGHTFVSEATLSSRLMAARKAIGDSGREQALIRTVRGRGYQFVALVEESDGIPARAPTPIELPPRRDGLIGRETELAALSALLETATTGQRRFALVTGEAGSGKTALVESFVDRAAEGAPLLVAQGRCVEQRGAVEPYMPILEALGRLARRPEGAAIVPTLSRLAPTWIAQMPGLVGEDELEAVRARVLGTRTDRMLREMAAALEALGALAPVLLVLDDLHWADESTLALIAHVARGTDPARLLIIGATRRVTGGPLNEMRRELLPRGQCEELAVGLLSPGTVREYLEDRYPGAESLAATINERSNGNPLFMECLVRSWVDSGALTRHDGSWVVAEAEGDLTLDIPETLRGLLEQHLERLTAEDQRALEVASAAGQDFSVAAVAAGLELGTDEVEERCADLARRGGFLRDRGAEAWPDGTVAGAFGFVHDLHRQVLYERMPAGRRARVHHRIAERLEAGYGDDAAQRAAELAAHYLEAGAAAPAVRYLELAAEQALERSAHRDAVDDLTTALDLLSRSPDLPNRDRHELSLRSALAGALAATEGFMSPDSERAYRRALELARELEERRAVAALLYELAAVHEMRGDHLGSEALLDEALRTEGVERDDARLLEAHELMACALFHQGSFQASLDHAERGLALHRADQRHPAQAYHGEDPAASCHDWAGLSLWCLGYAEQAMERIEAALELASEPGREHALANSRIHAARIHQQRREPDRTLDHADAAIALAGERGFAYQAAAGHILLGWGLAAIGEHETGLERIQEGMNANHAVGAAVDRPYFLALYAEALSQAGRPDEALDAIAEAVELASGDRSFFYEPELHRLRGALLFERDLAADAAEAEVSLRRALEVSRTYGARALELRAAVTLASMLRERGDGDEALGLLTDACGWFGAGAESVDLDEARAMIADLEREFRRTVRR